MMANGHAGRGIWTALWLAMLAVAAPAQETRVVPLATGDVTGVYFPVGLALCRLPNAGRREHGLRCAATLSAGSVDNLRRLRAGEADLAIVQSDTQSAALRGAGAFAGEGPFEDLRAVMALHSEPLMLVVGADAGVARLGDLPGRRVGISAPGAGDRALIEALSGRLGWGAATFAARVELAPEAMAAALCGGQVDAFLLAMGQPAGPVVEATRGCGARLVAIDGTAVEALAAVNPFYHVETLPAGTYEGQEADVATIAVGATLVTRADLPDAVVTTIGGAILDDLDTLRGLHPVLRDLEVAEMARRGLSAELHPAMAALYRARGAVE
jgi:TRAP transporter TAXI family solute receptor